MTEHRYSTETLVHYQCGFCFAWWSIGDGPANRILTCPWCAWSAECVPGVEPEPCDHNWTDMHNEVISHGWWCPKCNAVTDEEPKPTIKPNETSELRQHLKHAKDTVAQWPEEKLHGIERPQMAWRTHTGTTPPPDLAPAQMVEVERREDGTVFTNMQVANIGWERVKRYRPFLDPDGLPYVSAAGLEPWAEYVATDVDGNPRQFKREPTCYRDAGYWTPSRKSAPVMFPAPQSYRLPGDWRQSLARVWREG